MTTPTTPDVEIYLNKPDQAKLLSWLEKSFAPIESTPKKKGMPKKAQSYVGQYLNSTVPILIFEGVVPGYTSVWIDSTERPWETDETCAVEAAKALDCAVRITAGGWQQGDQPDAWVEVLPDGTKTELTWKDA